MTVIAHVIGRSERRCGLAALFAMFAPSVCGGLKSPGIAKILVNDRLVDFLEGEFDVGARGRLRDFSLIARRIAPIRLACAAPNYRAPRAADAR